jgi:GAF domain-containing protein
VSQARRIVLASLPEPGVAVSPATARDRDRRPNATAFRRLLRLMAAVTSGPHLAGALRAVAGEARALCRADRCAFFIVRGQSLLRITDRRITEVSREPAGRGARPRIVALDDVPAFARARRERKPVLISEPARNGHVPPEWRVGLGGAPFVAVPLLQGSRFLGVMALDNAPSGRPLTGVRLDVARIVADQAALALNHGRLARTVRTLLHDAEALLSAGTTVPALDLAEVVRRITREAARAVGADSAGVYVTTGGERYLEPLAAYHLPKRLLDSLCTEPLVRTEFDEILDRTRWTDDVAADPAFRHPLLARFPVRSLLLVPLKVRDARVGLLVCAWWTARRLLKPEEVRLVEAIAGQAAVAIEAARLARRAAEAAVGRERNRMDELLHDTVSATLFSLALKLDYCLHRADCSEDLRARLEGVKEHAKAMMTQIRGLVAPAAVRA